MSIVLIQIILAFSAARTEHMLLTSFDSDSPNLGWRVVNDGVMGGRSLGAFILADSILQFSGFTNTRGGGFSSIRTTPQKLTLADASGLKLRVRGDGRTYTFRLSTGGRVAYWADFATVPNQWQTVIMDFDRFRPRWRGRWMTGPDLLPRNIVGLGLMIYDGNDGPFRLDIDWIVGHNISVGTELTP